MDEGNLPLKDRRLVLVSFSCFENVVWFLDSRWMGVGMMLSVILVMDRIGRWSVEYLSCSENRI